MRVTDRGAPRIAHKEVVIVIVAPVTQVQPHVLAEGGDPVDARRRAHEIGDRRHLGFVEALVSNEAAGLLPVSRLAVPPELPAAAYTGPSPADGTSSIGVPSHQAR